MKSTNQLIAEKNRIEAQIMAIEERYESENATLLCEELKNLLDGVGKGYRPRDYYAEARYYSQIDGVENLRYGRYDSECDTHYIYVKIKSPAGYLLPDEIEIEEVKYKFDFFESKRYSDEIDY